MQFELVDGFKAGEHSLKCTDENGRVYYVGENAWGNAMWEEYAKENNIVKEG